MPTPFPSGNSGYLRNIDTSISRDSGPLEALSIKLVCFASNHRRGTRRLPDSSHSTRQVPLSTTGPVPSERPKFFELNILPISPTDTIFCADFRLSPPMFSIFYEEGGEGVLLATVKSARFSKWECP